MELGFIIDIVILLFLAATIFYAIRLSSQLKILKDSKSELEQLVSNLAINITRAQEAIQEMHDVADDSGAHLHGLLKKAQGLSDELQIITEAGNSLANRLEGLAGDAGRKSQYNKQQHAMSHDDTEEEDEMGYNTSEPQPQPETRPQRRKTDTQDKSSSARREPTAKGGSDNIASFAIRDREYETFYDEDNEDDDRVDEEFDALTSRAEKDLAHALKRRRGYDA